MNEVIEISSRCPIRTTLELVGGKWRLLILFQLRNKALRLSALKASLPDISEKMLIQELKNLTQSDLVKRINYGEVPPRVEYCITELGKGALPIIEIMKDFAENYWASMHKPREL